MTAIVPVEGFSESEVLLPDDVVEHLVLCERRIGRRREAQRVIGTALQDGYRRFALYYSIAAASMLTLGLIV